jgi:hypothetical protein
MSAIGAGLFSIGIPKDSIVEYELALKTDKFLLLVHGTISDVEKAREALEDTHSLGMKLHSKEMAGAAC